MTNSPIEGSFVDRYKNSMTYLKVMVTIAVILQVIDTVFR